MHLDLQGTSELFPNSQRVTDYPGITSVSPQRDATNFMEKMIGQSVKSDPTIALRVYESTPRSHDGPSSVIPESGLEEQRVWIEPGL